MYHSACICEDLKVFTWGAGSKGQLGHVEDNDEWLPRLVAGLQGEYAYIYIVYIYMYVYICKYIYMHICTYVYI